MDKRRLLKKAGAFFLTAAMAFTIVPAENRPIEAEAATNGKTADDAINWAKSQLGKALDYDHVYGAQCVDFIAFYYQFLGNRVPGGNANTYSYNALPNGWTRIKGAHPQKGDILVFTGGGYGHVCIYESDYSTYHQNYGGMYVRNITNRRYDQVGYGYWGVIRPDFAPGDVASTYNVRLSSSPAVKDGDYYILAGSDHSYGLSVRGDSKDNFGNVHLWKHIDDYNAMKWHFTYMNNGYYEITNVNSGKCLDVSKGGTFAGTNVQQYERNNLPPQRWNVASAGNGNYYLVPQCATNRALDINAGTLKDGQNIQIWAQNGLFPQWFYLEPVVCKHNYKEEITKQPTCTTDGVKTYTCTKCGDKKTETIKAAGHKWDSGKITKKPTATDTGVKTFTCSVCKQTRTENIPATGIIEDNHSSNSNNNNNSNNDSSSLINENGQNDSSDSLGSNNSGSENNNGLSSEDSSETGTNDTSSNDDTSGNDDAEDGTDDVLVVGSPIITDNASYVVTNLSGSYEVKLSEMFDDDAASFDVPDAITDQATGTVLKVTEIDEKAFYKLKGLKTVTIGNNITKIGAKAFYGCAALKKITISSSVIKSIGKKAFVKISGRAKVYVPKARFKAYKKLLKKAGLGKRAKIIKRR